MVDHYKDLLKNIGGSQEMSQQVQGESQNFQGKYLIAWITNYETSFSSNFAIEILDETNK